MDPMKKAKQSVIDVIVIDGPACIMPRLILSRDDKWQGCQSIELHITNMSSTPIPIMRGGRIQVISVASQPLSKAIPNPAAQAAMTTTIPKNESVSRQCRGLHDPKKSAKQMQIVPIANATSLMSPNSSAMTSFNQEPYLTYALMYFAWLLKSMIASSRFKSHAFQSIGTLPLW